MTYLVNKKEPPESGNTVAVLVLRQHFRWFTRAQYSTYSKDFNLFNLEMEPKQL